VNTCRSEALKVRRGWRGEKIGNEVRLGLGNGQSRLAELGLIAKERELWLLLWWWWSLLRGFRDVSVLAVLVTAYEIIAAAVLRSAVSALGSLQRTAVVVCGGKIW
jgi:hypothetical protein